MPLQRRHGAAVLNRARGHIDTGELVAARELLGEVLADLPSDPRRARPAEAEAIALQTGVLLSLGEADAARGWAAYGHVACRRLYGDHDRRTLHTLGLLAAVLARVGAHGRAAQRYQTLIEIFTELDGPRSERALAARADLATVEHARGQCVSARRLLADVVAEHRETFGAAHPVGVRMRARLAAMWRDCGDPQRARALLDQARADATGLDQWIRDLVDVAGATAPDPRHVCGARGAADPEPAEPVAEVPVAAGDLVPRQAGPPVPESPLGPPFSTVSYLPAHPLLVAWEPLPPQSGPARTVPRQMSPATFALIAAIVGIVAVTVLFLLLVSAVRGD